MRKNYFQIIAFLFMLIIFSLTAFSAGGKKNKVKASAAAGTAAGGGAAAVEPVIPSYALVRTWGADHNSNQITSSLDKQRYNLNPGHASLEIFISDTPENRELVEHYTQNVANREEIFSLPYSYIVKGSNKYIKLYFSFFPASEGAFYLVETVHHDQIAERAAAHEVETAGGAGGGGSPSLAGKGAGKQSRVSKFGLTQRVITMAPYFHYANPFEPANAGLPEDGVDRRTFRDLRLLLLSYLKIYGDQINAINADPAQDHDQRISSVAGVNAGFAGKLLLMRTQFEGKLSPDPITSATLKVFFYDTIRKRIDQFPLKTIMGKDAYHVFVNSLRHDSLNISEDLATNPALTESLNNFLDFEEYARIYLLGYHFDTMTLARVPSTMQIDEDGTEQEVYAKTVSIEDEVEARRLKREISRVLRNSDFTEQYIVTGLPPRGTYRLPIRLSGDGENHGLELAPLLEEMHRILAEPIPYGLYNKNCSSTVMSIIQAALAHDLALNHHNYVIEVRGTDYLVRSGQRWDSRLMKAAVKCLDWTEKVVADPARVGIFCKQVLDNLAVITGKGQDK